MSSNIDPLPLQALAADLPQGHGLPEQRGELERAIRAPLEQQGMQDSNAAISQFVGSRAVIVNLSVEQDKITTRMMLGVVHQHQMRQALKRPAQGAEIEIGPYIAIDHHERLVPQQR